ILLFNPIIIALRKSAMFDEGSFLRNNRILQIICMILLFAGTLTAVVSFVSLIPVIRRFVQKIYAAVFR
ncbi:MAG: hypothetical protein II388_10715, partial [Clostridia bacterium]|nr:hypothetical protein [Clostridia bacterium]